MFSLIHSSLPLLKADRLLIMFSSCQTRSSNYHKDFVLPGCAKKVDLIKAYDSVAWNFSFDVMTIMDFPAVFIHSV